MAGCRSPQEDRAVHHGCRPFERRGETRVPARSRTSSTGTHERSIGAGSRGERLALEKTERRVRRCGLTKKWPRAGRQVGTGVVGTARNNHPALTTSSIMGARYDSIAASGRDCSGACVPCQRRPGDPGDCGKARRSRLQARPAILSRRRCEPTPPRRLRCGACRRALLCRTDASASPPAAGPLTQRRSPGSRRVWEAPRCAVLALGWDWP
jgi:hypothetical protein